MWKGRETELSLESTKGNKLRWISIGAEQNDAETE